MGRMIQVQNAVSEVQAAGVGRIARAGVGGALAYLVAMWVDELVFREPTDDLVLVGGFGSKGEVGSRVLGLLVHCTTGVLIAGVYAAIARRRLRGPAWSRGLTTGVAENTLLWPMVALMDAFHPWIRAGRLPRYNRGVPWVQSVARHVAFGAAMGTLLGLPEDDRAREAVDARASDGARGGVAVGASAGAGEGSDRAGTAVPG